MEFAKDLQDLHPLSKLKGIHANVESRSQLPNLEATTVDFSDDLVMAIDELLNPNEDGAGFTATQSWRDSQTRVYAAGEIIRKLDNFEQPDLVSESLSTLNSHIR